MLAFTLEDLKKRPEAIEDAAMISPVAIGDGQHRQFILLTADRYEALRERDRRVYRVEDLPQSYDALLAAVADQPYDVD